MKNAREKENSAMERKSIIVSIATNTNRKPIKSELIVLMSAIGLLVYSKKVVALEALLEF